MLSVIFHYVFEVIYLALTLGSLDLQGINCPKLLLITKIVMKILHIQKTILKSKQCRKSYWWIKLKP